MFRGPRKETFIICNPLMSHNEYFSRLRIIEVCHKPFLLFLLFKKNITNVILNGYNNTESYYLKQKL